VELIHVFNPKTETQTCGTAWNLDTIWHRVDGIWRSFVLLTCVFEFKQSMSEHFFEFKQHVDGKC
jgi:hypothetical protein